MRTSQTPLLGSAALRLVLNAHVADSFFNTHLADSFGRFASLHWRARLRCGPPSVECAPGRSFLMGKLTASAATLCFAWCEGAAILDITDPPSLVLADEQGAGRTRRPEGSYVGQSS